MKTLLVPIEDHNQTASMLATAELFARKLGSSVDGVALRLIQFQAVGAEPIVAVTFPPVGGDDDDTAARARRRFDQHVASVGPDAPRMRWRGGDAIEDTGLGMLGRVYDLTVVGRPTNAGPGSRMTTLESALFESGRPILIAPLEPPKTIATRVVIAWNRSTEAAQTMTAVLPVLHLAETVTIITVETATVPGPSGDELRDYLEAHGITATAKTVPNGPGGAGATILDHAGQLGCDLLVKSAYTQSRLRQMIFGGATSHILSNATLPVFMAN